jgi:cell division septation protein DedD
MQWRQKVFFSRLEWGENNRGDILNISPSGLALQTDHELNDDELPKMRFQLSQAPAWIEAKGRIVWRNDSKKVAGVEFIDLSAETRKQILLSIFLTSDESEFPKTDAPLEKTEQPNEAMGISEPTFPFIESTNVELVPGDQSQQLIFPSVQSPTETHDAGTVSESATTAKVTSGSGVEAVSEDRSQQSIFPSVQSPAELHDPGTVSENAKAATVAGGSGKVGRPIGLSLAVVLLLLAFLPLRHYLQKAGTSQKGRETATEPNLPRPSSKIPATPPPSPEPSLNHPAPTSNPGPSMDHSAFVLQVGAMVHEENANALANSLRQMNFPVFVFKSPTDRFHRVVVGPYDGVDATLRARNQLEKRGFRAIRKEWKAASP